MARAVRTITAAERRARLVARHRLTAATRADTATEVAGDLVGLHGTDPATVYLSALARMRAGTVAAIQRELYEERSLVRLLGMRRTMFVAPVELAGIIQAAAGRAVAAQIRRRYVDLIAKAGVVADTGPWLREVEDGTVRALYARGEATGAELAADEPRLRTAIHMAQGKAYEARQNITTWVLTLLAADGRIVRGRPRGSWISSQYRWSPMDVWLPGGLPDWPTAQAQVELVRRWLRAFGPGTVKDLRWWTGWTAGDVNKALAPLGPVEVDLDGAPGLVLPDDVEPVAAGAVDEPSAALLPALDPTPMGWTERGWYLGTHAPTLFDRSGNVGPTVWWAGRIVGGWGQRPDGTIAYRLLEDVGSDAAAAIEAEATRAQGWFDGVRVTPRFRTPLERELSA